MAAATGIGAHVIRFENGVVDPAGLTGLPGGVTVGDLGSDETATARLAELAPKCHPVSDLSIAVMNGGLVIDVEVVVETPLMLLFEGDDRAASAHPATLVRLAAGAKLQLAEWHLSLIHI